MDEDLREASYGQIVRSSAIMGSAQVVGYLISLLRTKVAAVLLGPSGIGLIGLYLSATSLVATISQMGINDSGVRALSQAAAANRPSELARTAAILRRLCWITGLGGWLTTVLLAVPLSIWAFGSGERAIEVAVLGATVLLGSLAAAWSALLQGTRRIGDLARINVLSAAVGTLVTIALYAAFREDGIVPALIATGAVSLFFAHRFARSIPLERVLPSWDETVSGGRRLVIVGMAFMYGTLLVGLVALWLRATIVRELGLEANGIYQAAWAMSGMFATFVLTAMSAEYFPRLTGLADRHPELNRLVNEQTEVGVLLAVPGLIMTLGFAPAIVQLLYSREFLPAIDLMPWFIMAVLGQVVSWPVGMIQMATGSTRWLYITQTHGNVLHVLLISVLLGRFGLQGVAMAFAIYVWVQLGLVVLVGRRLTGFRWRRETRRVIGIALAAMLTCLVLEAFIDGLSHVLAVVALTVIVTVWAFHALVVRLGPRHRLTQTLVSVPLLGRWLTNSLRGQRPNDGGEQKDSLSPMQILKRFVGRLSAIGKPWIAVVETVFLPSQKRRWEAVARQGPPPWDARNRVLGGLIPPGSTVYDIGAGAQTLRDYLPEGCRYVACDLVKSTPDVVLCDLNAGVYPPHDPACTHAVCSGVFEYMRRPREFLRWVSGFAPETILTYNPMRPGDSKLTRMSYHWCNHFTKEELGALFASLDLDARTIATLQNHEIVYRISRRQSGRG